MRRLVLPIVAAALAASALPAHAEQVDIGVTVGNDFSATAYGTSTHPGETFGNFEITRVSVTDAGLPVVTTSGATMAGIPGATAGTATYVVNAHPINGGEPSAFFFTSIVVCTKLPGENVSCLPGVGEHTVISALTGP